MSETNPQGGAQAFDKVLASCQPERRKNKALGCRYPHQHGPSALICGDLNDHNNLGPVPRKIPPICFFFLANFSPASRSEAGCSLGILPPPSVPYGIPSSDEISIIGSPSPSPFRIPNSKLHQKVMQTVCSPFSD